MSWAPEDAREVGYVLKSAGLGANGKVWDRGFYEDGVALIEAADACAHGNSKPGEEGSKLSDVVALVTLQFHSGGLLDSEPVDDCSHLVRMNARGGTPGPTLCGIDRFAPNCSGWSVGGGITGPCVVHKPCSGCAEVRSSQFPNLPVRGSVGKEAWGVKE